MAKILFVQYLLRPPGGAWAVAVWMLEALRREHDITLLTWEPVDLDEINRYYGTSLQTGDFQLYCMSPLTRALFRLDQTPGKVIRPIAHLWRRCKRMRRAYDLCISATAETDFGCGGIQYIHHPLLNRLYASEQSNPLRPVWRSHVTRWKRTCQPWRMLSHYSFARMKENLSLTNSDYVANIMKRVYGIDATTLYPPVQRKFPTVPWEQRANGFVCCGRFHCGKRFRQMIRILAAVRASVPDVQLHIVGSTLFDTPAQRHYGRRLRTLVQANAAWVHLHENCSRQELLKLIAHHRYGIHGMPKEDFGMAVAEFVAGGCIPFAPNGGGQVEIVGRDERLLYGSTAEAVTKILRVLRNPAEQMMLRNALDAQRRLFSNDRFVRRIQEIVQQFQAGRQLAAANGTVVDDLLARPAPDERIDQVRADE